MIVTNKTLYNKVFSAKVIWAFWRFRSYTAQAFGTFVLDYLPLTIKNKITIQRPSAPVYYILYIVNGRCNFVMPMLRRTNAFLMLNSKALFVLFYALLLYENPTKLQNSLTFTNIQSSILNFMGANHLMLLISQ